MNNNLLILGAGGHAKVVLETAKELNLYKSFGFLDDLVDNENNNEKLLKNFYPLLGKISDYKKKNLFMDYQNAFVAIGDPHKRLKLIFELKRHSFKVPNLIHPSAYVSKSAVIGEGSVIMANAVVQSNVKIGSGVIVNTSAIVEHDTSLSDGVHICPGVNLAGEIKIGYCSWIGIGSSIVQGIAIGSRVTIGAGSVVLKNIEDSATAVGIPASIINKSI